MPWFPEGFSIHLLSSIFVTAASDFQMICRVWQCYFYNFRRFKHIYRSGASHREDYKGSNQHDTSNHKWVGRCIHRVLGLVSCLFWQLYICCICVAFSLYRWAIGSHISAHYSIFAPDFCVLPPTTYTIITSWEHQRWCLSVWKSFEQFVANTSHGFVSSVKTLLENGSCLKNKLLYKTFYSRDYLFVVSLFWM